MIAFPDCWKSSPAGEGKPSTNVCIMARSQPLLRLWDASSFHRDMPQGNALAAIRGTGASCHIDAPS